MIPLRRLTDRGIEQMHSMLDDAEAGRDPNFVALRDDPRYTELISDTPVFEVRSYATRYEYAASMSKTLSALAWRVDDLPRNRGLWSWMALALIEYLAPRAPSGDRRLGERARWVLVTDDFRRYYRHLLAGPYNIFRTHADSPRSAMALLATPLNRPGDVVEQLASRQEIVSNPRLLGLITQLYFDPESKGLRRGAAGKGAGSARRLADVLAQLDLTWDIYGMEPESLQEILPTEFSRFLSDQ